MSNYQPDPIDTSGIELSPHLDALVEQLAENAHDVWARKRMKEGWKHGPKKDSAARITPFLVPYRELPESERETDRVMVRQVLKVAQHHGWQLQHRQLDLTAEERKALTDWTAWLDGQAALPERSWSIDTDDRPEISSSAIAPFPHARSALEDLDALLRPAFDEADEEAVATQKRHRLIARWAIWPGALAIVFAIAQLTIKSMHMEKLWLNVAFTCEVLALVLASVAVVLGVTSRFHRRWLHTRQLAERLRSLKFEMLAHGSLWSDREAWKRAITARIEQVRESCGRGWFEQEEPPDLDVEPIEGEVPAADFYALAYLNRTKRLRHQRAYFVRQAKSAHGRSKFHSLGMSYKIFFVSALFVAAHSLLHLYPFENSKPYEILTLAIAAALPVIGFAWRAWTGAFEAPRSHNLFRAKAHNLDGRILRFENALTDSARIQQLIAEGEEFFLGEHREWCRLQAEAEWLL